MQLAVFVWHEKLKIAKNFVHEVNVGQIYLSELDIKKSQKTKLLVKLFLAYT